MKRTVKEWREIVQSGKSSTELAKFVLSDLTGYRDNNVYRTEDLVSLSNLFYSLFEDICEAQHPVRQYEESEL